jgi:hypothetical protein
MVTITEETKVWTLPERHFVTKYAGAEVTYNKIRKLQILNVISSDFEAAATLYASIKNGAVIRHAP